jgi:iron complex transport system ATP-binding protein
MSIIQLKSLSFSYSRSTPVLTDISLSVESGETWAIIGKNGSGKSTFLKCLGGLLKTEASCVLVEGKYITHYNSIELAKLITYVPQAGARALPSFSVSEFVMLGRFPYQGFFALPIKEDREIVNEALRLTDTWSLSGRSMNTLSGGELQRVYLAAAVAQKTPIFLLDEPMSFLDPQHQEIILRSLKRIHDEFHTTIIAVTHEINLAVNRFSHICALIDGSKYFSGPVSLFTKEAVRHLNAIYSMSFQEIKDRDTGVYFVPKESAT